MQKNTYNLLSSLLGKPESSQSYFEFLKHIKTKPEVVEDNNQARSYAFMEEGIYLRYDKAQDMFEFFALELAHTPGSVSKLYCGPLPSGIERTDTPSEIESKLGIKPVGPIKSLGKQKEIAYNLHYQLLLFLLVIAFESESNKICGIIVHFRPKELQNPSSSK